MGTLIQLQYKAQTSGKAYKMPRTPGPVGLSKGSRSTSKRKKTVERLQLYSEINLKIHASSLVWHSENPVLPASSEAS